MPKGERLPGPAGVGVVGNGHGGGDAENVVPFGRATVEMPARPAPFRLSDVANVKRWVEWDDEDAGPFRGFAVLVTANMTVAERGALNAKTDEVRAYDRAWSDWIVADRELKRLTLVAGTARAAGLAGDTDKADAAVAEATKRVADLEPRLVRDEAGEVVTPRMVEFRMLAPYVHDWNAVDGEDRPIPPPAVAGPAAFEALYPEQSLWIRSVVLAGWRGGKGRTSSGAR